VADAAIYIGLCRDALGPQALNSRRFRIGASGLLNDIEALLSGQAPNQPAAAGGY
jgi:deoxyribose-phosphate aldolase